MASAHDVAKYILEKHGAMSAMKLEKLVYYSQAWSLVWDERPMFDERIEAWIGGPVVPALFALHKGQFEVDGWPSGDTTKLDKDAKETIDIVIRDYGSETGQALSDLTHSEDPWISARKGLPENERGNREITKESMRTYYHALSNNSNGQF
jgi:uncharacterized phage-associated protein